MAPVNGANNKPVKTSARRASSKTVVPVLPLNYPQRTVNRQVSAPPKSSPLAEAQPRQQVAEEQSDERSAGNSSNNNELNNLNGSAEHLDRAGPASAEEAKSARDPAPTPVPAQMVPTSTESTATPALSAGASTGTPTVVAAPPGYSVAASTPTPPSDPAVPASNSPSLHGPAHDQPTLAPQPALAFRPAFHQAHPSNGSMVFGGFQDSNASSPAPHSAGGFPPPDMMAYPPAVAPVDAYGRPLLVSPTLDGYPPAVINHPGPPTPHSFHGSHASAQAEDHSHNHHPAVNGANGYANDPLPQVSAVPTMNPHVNGSMHPSAGSSSAVLQNLRDQEEDAVNFLRSGFEDPTFNDVILELHFPEIGHYQSHPDFRLLRPMMRIPAHRFILSRSRVLAGILKSQRGPPGGVVRLELRGEYMRPDVFYTAIRTMYGWPLAENTIFPTELCLRDVQDDFNLALSYITVGQYLELGWVHTIALRRASQLLFWETLELAARFVLPTNISARSRNDPFSTMKLLGHILGFIVKNFPKDFVLDVNAGDFGFNRLPAVNPPKMPSPPSIAHGSSGGLHSRQLSKQSNVPRGPRLSTNPRLSEIKFGDLSPSPPHQTGSGTAGAQDVTPRRRSPTTNETILSRILLNLPYELLKQILEDPNLAGAPGEINPLTRQSIITDIIAEREARRLRTLDKSQTHLHFLQQTLDKCAAPLVVEQMGDFLVNNMGFKEEVCPGDIPFLVHTWTQPSSGSSA